MSILQEWEKLRDDMAEIKAKEEREAWDRYFAASSTMTLPAPVSLSWALDRADKMLEERRKRWA